MLFLAVQICTVCFFILFETDNKITSQVKTCCKFINVACCFISYFQSNFSLLGSKIIESYANLISIATRSQETATSVLFFKIYITYKIKSYHNIIYHSCSRHVSSWLCYSLLGWQRHCWYESESELMGWLMGVRTRGMCHLVLFIVRQIKSDFVVCAHTRTAQTVTLTLERLNKD